MSSKYISSDGTEILPLEQNINLYLNKSIILNGHSKTGKSVIIKYILSLLKDKADELIIISPREYYLKEYENISFKNQNICIYNDMTNDPSKFLKDILEKQDAYNNNNNLIIVFDKCDDILNPISRKNNNILNTYFYKGGHSHITQIYTCLDDKVFPPNIRKNACINIFTCKETALNHFGNKVNGYTKKEPKLIEEIGKKLIDEKSPYNKLYYFRDNEKNKFFYTSVPLID